MAGRKPDTDFPLGCVIETFPVANETTGITTEKQYVLWYSGELPYVVSDRKTASKQTVIKKDGPYTVRNTERGVTRYYRQPGTLSYATYTGRPFQAVCRDRRAMCDSNAYITAPFALPLLAVKSVVEEGSCEANFLHVQTKYAQSGDNSSKEVLCPGRMSYGYFEGTVWTAMPDAEGSTCTTFDQAVMDQSEPPATFIPSAVEFARLNEILIEQQELQAITALADYTRIRANQIAGSVLRCSDPDSRDPNTGFCQASMRESECDYDSVPPNRDLSKDNRKLCRKHRSSRRGRRFGFVVLGVVILGVLAFASEN